MINGRCESMGHRSWVVRSRQAESDTLLIAIDLQRHGEFASTRLHRPCERDRRGLHDALESFLRLRYRVVRLRAERGGWAHRQPDAAPELAIIERDRSDGVPFQRPSESARDRAIGEDVAPADAVATRKRDVEPGLQRPRRQATQPVRDDQAQALQRVAFLDASAIEPGAGSCSR